jgi:tRNA(Ile)-lysidine synthase
MAQPKQLSIEQRVLNFIRQNELAKPEQKILVAVSGGADSVCLLHVLNQIKNELHVNLHVAHLNHQLRGQESVGDAAFVKDLARKLDLPISIKSADVLTYQLKHHLTLEEAAREVRYAFMNETARSVGADSVAVGHTQNDQVETILLHVIRGTGTLGLQGLRPSHILHLPNGPLKVIRPLLDISRTEVEDYCLLNVLSFRQDSSNLSLAMLRNRVRLELLPLLNEYNPDVADSLLRISRIARDEAVYLEAETGHLWSQIGLQNGSNIIFSKDQFLALPAALQRQMLRRAFAELLGSLKDIETRHIEAILNALRKPAGRKLHLPGNIVFSIEYSRYILGRDVQSLVPFPELEGEMSIAVPGQTIFPGWLVQTQILPVTNYDFESESREKWQNHEFAADFDLALVKNGLTLRSLRPGDAFQPLGLAHLKKVARFMLDAQIPHDWRSRVPLVCNSKQIIWVAGWRIDDRVKVTPSTRSTLRIKLIRQG